MRRILHGRLLEADAAGIRTREEIVASWRRSARAGLEPDRFDVPYHDSLDGEGRVARAAAPILERLGAELADACRERPHEPGGGARLFVSRHTIDYHLRQIYRKLDITSRVDLTRVVTQHPSV